MNAKIPARELIKSWRQVNQWPQKRLAAACGITESYINRVETGASKIGWPLAKTLHQVTGIPLDQLRPDIWGVD